MKHFTPAYSNKALVALMTLAALPALCLLVFKWVSLAPMPAPVVAPRACPTAPLCFTAESDDAAVALMEADEDDNGTDGEAPEVSLEISTDGENWTEWEKPRQVALPRKGDKVFVRAAGENQAFGGGDQFSAWEESQDGLFYHIEQFFPTACNRFAIVGQVAASGDVMSLLDRNGKLRSLAERPFAFWGLFSGCPGLTTPPELPAIRLDAYCYYKMFKGCTGLRAAPKLPATALAESCYHAMFEGCTGLKIAPELPATKLARECYSRIFMNCPSLTAAPKLPATKMEDSCYSEMFRGCAGLRIAPEVPKGVDLTGRDCIGMFKGCEQLNDDPNKKK